MVDFPLIFGICAFFVVLSIIVSLRLEKREAKRPGLKKRLLQAEKLFLEGKYHSTLREVEALRADQERLLGPEDEDTLATRNSLGVVLHAQGRYREARAELESVLKVEMRYPRAVVPPPSETPVTLVNLTAALLGCGAYHEAEKMSRENLPWIEKARGICHLYVLMLRCHLGITLARLHRLDEAESELQEVCARFKQKAAESDPMCLSCRTNLIWVMNEQKRHGEAEAEARALLPLMENAVGPEDRRVSTVNANLADSLAGQGKLEEAETLYRVSAQHREKVLGSGHPETLAVLHHLARCLKQQGRTEEARELATRVVEGWRETLGEDHPETAKAAELLAEVA